MLPIPGFHHLHLNSVDPDAAVDDDWKLSRQIGVTGVPTFVAGRYGVVGAQPYEALEALVRKAEPEGDAEE